MPVSWPASVARLLRLGNLLMAALGTAIGGVLVTGRLELPDAIVWAMLSAMGLGAAGNIADDLADVAIDRVNRPERPLPSGAVSATTAVLLGGVCGGLGLFAAYWTGPRVFAVGLAALVVMLAYSPVLKQAGVAGNLAVAVVAALPPLYGALALGWWRPGLVPFVMGALLHFAREVVKDIEDEPGDRAAGRRTLPVTHGREAAFLVAALALIVFVPASLAPWFARWYGQRYGLGVLALDVVLLAFVWRLLGRQLTGARAMLKLAMLAGLAVLLWDRL